LRLATTNIRGIVSTRANIEADLAKAEEDLANAAANLAKTCATPAETRACLPRAFSNITKVKVDVGQANADLANARIVCRRARIALASLNRVEGMPIDYRSIPTSLVDEAVFDITHIDWRLARSGLAVRKSAEIIAESDGWTDKPEERSAAIRSSNQQSEDQGLIRRASVRDVSSNDTGKWRSLAWQAAELSSLTLAYLLYYYIDVNLQIAMLPPSVSSVLVG
jgi:hypothetical protein